MLVSTRLKVLVSTRLKVLVSARLKVVKVEDSAVQEGARDVIHRSYQYYSITIATYM